MRWLLEGESRWCVCICLSKTASAQQKAGNRFTKQAVVDTAQRFVVAVAATGCKEGRLKGNVVELCARLLQVQVRVESRNC